MAHDIDKWWRVREFGPGDCLGNPTGFLVCRGAMETYEEAPNSRFVVDIYERGKSPRETYVKAQSMCDRMNGETVVQDRGE